MTIYPDSTTVFLAGTIDNGDSTNWQEEVIKKFEDTYDRQITFFNPRRKDWNQNPIDLRGQIKWEQRHLDAADHIVLCLLDNSKSPISLLELGLYAQSKKIHVFCNPEFYRYYNVKLTCEKYNIPLHPFSVEEVVYTLNNL